MGGGIWSSTVGLQSYSNLRARRIAEVGTPMAYDAEVRTRPASEWRVHAQMDPRGVTRESRDSAAHPESLAVMVMFDVTGSMGHVPVELEDRLPRLMGLLLERGYAQDPQVLFGAIGDGRVDRGPLQVGQFESDAQMDEDLGRIWLEAGGGDAPESYGLAHYFAARHTATDCWEKRGKKGYLFTIGDEAPHAVVTRREIQHTTGDPVQNDVPLETVIAEAQERFHVFHLIVGRQGHGALPAWQNYLGDAAVVIGPNVRHVAETIALLVGLTEGTVTTADGRQHLRDLGVAADVIDTIMAAAQPAVEAVRGIRLEEARP